MNTNEILMVLIFCAVVFGGVWALYRFFGNRKNIQ